MVGYTRNDSNLLAEVKRLDLKKITHLNIAFINPDTAGQFVTPADLRKVAKVAHKKHITVLLSIAGGSPPAYLPGLLSGSKQAVLINALLKMVTDNDIDGVDADLENSMINNNYEPFVTALGLALKANNKLMTAAIATDYKNQYTDKALRQFDFLNVMSYDRTGPWRPAKPGQHAPYSMAAADLDYWVNKRGIAKEKISLGVPFYGYGFGQGAPESMSYRNIIKTYPNAQNTDQVTVPGGGIIYYNGAATIKAKTRLALDAAGGIMIWQLLQDAPGNGALLKVINKEIRRK